MRSCDKLNNISITAICLATKLGMVGIYNQKFPFINSNNSLMTWSCKVTWNIRYAISLLQQGLWPPNLVRWWLAMRSFHPKSYTKLWTRGHVRPCDRLKALSPLPRCLWPTNLKGLSHSMRSLPWSCKFTWQIKYVISPLPQWLWLPNLTGWFHTMKNFLR